MILIYGVFKDGTKTLLTKEKDDFNVQRWANLRKDSFHLLDIVEIYYEKLEITCPNCGEKL